MQLSDLISTDGVVPSLKVSSKKQALQELAQLAAKVTGLSSRDVFETLLQRERLGSTGPGSAKTLAQEVALRLDHREVAVGSALQQGLGQGIAIPHGKLPGLERLHGIFARLDTAIEFDALDGQKVDLIFLLLAPESAGADHLKALARVSRMLRDGSVATKLRGSDDRSALYAILTEPAASHAA